MGVSRVRLSPALQPDGDSTGWPGFMEEPAASCCKGRSGPSVCWPSGTLLRHRPLHLGSRKLCSKGRQAWTALGPTLVAVDLG